MLRIWFENKRYFKLPVQDRIFRDIDAWFDTCYDPKWSKDPLVREMVKAIDKSEIIDYNVISPILGSISVRNLSSGVKFLISVYCAGNPDNLIFSTTSCGDNCCYWISEISKRCDAEIATSIFHMDFQPDFTFKCMNNGKVYTTYEDYLLCASKIICEGVIP